jgi:hypothetical protein
MNPKQKKLIWIAGIAVAIWYIAPTFINTARQQTMIRQQQAAIAAKVQAAKAAQEAALAHPPQPVAPTPAQQANALLGIWQGMGIVDGQGNCNLRLELRNGPEPAKINGFPVLICIPMPLTPANGSPQKLLTPATAMLSGTPSPTGIDFTVDKVMSKGGTQCSFTSFNVTPFGNDQISAEWKEDPCGSGQMLLKRAGR